MPNSPITRTSVKGSPSWQAWLRAFAKAQRQGPSQLIDAALAEHAAAKGYETPPTRIDVRTIDAGTSDLEALDSGEYASTKIRHPLNEGRSLRRLGQ